MKRLLALALLVACAGPSSHKGRETLTLDATGTAHAVSLGADGDVIGPALVLEPTGNGYRGVVNAFPVELRSDGKRIQGTMRSQPVDLHLAAEGAGLTAAGLFAGRLGRLSTSPSTIHSTLGPCAYELVARAGRFEGQTACTTGRAPVIRPAALDLPPRFSRLPAERQLMVLAVLLTR